MAGERRARLSINVDPDLWRQIKIAAAEKDLPVRDYVEAILRQALRGDATNSTQSPPGRSSPDADQPAVRDRLTPEEQARGRRALAELERLNQEMLQQRGGRPLSPSWELLDEARDQRTRELMGEE